MHRTMPFQSLEERQHLLIQYRQELREVVKNLEESGELSVQIPWGSASLSRNDLSVISTVVQRSPWLTTHLSQSPIHVITEWLFEWRMVGDHRPNLERFTIDMDKSDWRSARTVELEKKSIAMLEKEFLERKKE